MARTAGKKQAPAKIEEDDDAEGWEDAVVDADEKDAEANLRLRDWRDVERFREMKELRSLVDDDYGLEEIFHIPLRPRAEPGIPAPRTPAKGQPQKAPPAGKPLVEAKPAARNAHSVTKPAKPAAKANPKPTAHEKAPAKLKAKVKRK